MFTTELVVTGASSTWGASFKLKGMGEASIFSGEVIDARFDGVATGVGRIPIVTLTPLP
jgi:hypothetical protein